MDWLRDGLAKLLLQTPQDAFTESVLVVFFETPMVYRYVKGRIYDKPLTNDLDPQLLAAFDNQQDIRLLQADTMRSPYSNTPFAHQYLHVYALPQGLLLVQQKEYDELLDSMGLLLTAMTLLLKQAQLHQQLNRYRDWLTKAGMNHTSGTLQADHEYFTPYPAPTFEQTTDGFYPYHALALSMTAPYSVIEVIISAHSTRLFHVHPTWYQRDNAYYMSIPTLDKRVINRYVNEVLKQFAEPFEQPMISVARSTDPLPFEQVLAALREEATRYYPPVRTRLLDDVTVAMATTKRIRIRNHANQWVADYFVPPKMTLPCELAWLSALLSVTPPRTRYVEISETLANHPDSATYFKQHRMGAMFAKTCIIANHIQGALASYLQAKNAIIGSRDWNTLMTTEVDVFFFDHVATQDDEPLLDYLYHRQMTKGTAFIFPIRNQQDALWLINHSVGLFYKEDANE